jgi:hypothetical protein
MDKLGRSRRARVPATTSPTPSTPGTLVRWWASTIRACHFLSAVCLGAAIEREVFLGPPLPQPTRRGSPPALLVVVHGFLARGAEHAH